MQLAQVGDWSITNIKGELVALVILYVLAVLGLFGIGASFRGHVNI